jgi:3-deoxy-manno-octulosonate cytidylyltransferase (CMP-KDO synthetase)
VTPKTVAVIPARYGSTRFPGKPLALLRGKAVIEHVYTRVRMCPSVESVLVATDDEMILSAVRAFGGEAVMTSGEHRSGSDRLGEVARDLDADIILNVQGDEPMMEPRVVESVLRPMGVPDPPDIATAAVALLEEEYRNPNVVKVVVNREGRALYFSRSPIPHGWDPNRPGLRHLGIYAYRRDSLLRFVSLPQSPLEMSENLEQLRALEDGMKIVVVKVDHFTGIGVDCPEDLHRAEQMMEILERDDRPGNQGGAQEGS